MALLNNFNFKYHTTKSKTKVATIDHYKSYGLTINIIDYLQCISNKELKSFKRKIGNHYIIKIIINLPLITYGDKAKLYNVKDFNKFRFNFENTINSLNDILKPFTINISDFKVTRVDYAYDYNTPYVMEYITLFKCFPYRKYFTKDEPHYSGIHPYNNSYSYNIYSKYIERLKEEPDNADHYKDILRFEVQIRNSNYIRSDIDKNRNLYTILQNHRTACNMILGFFKNTTTANFYQVQTLKNKVNKLFNTKKSRNIIINLQQINQKKFDYRKVEFKKIKAFPIGVSKNTFLRYLRELSKNNIAPITIPKTWKVTQLKNPYHEIKENLQQF